jgi:hypothetical protein
MTEPPLKRENLLLLGQCYFFEKNYDAALETFQRLFDDASAPVSLVEETGEWMRRCRWFRENEKKYKPVLR